MSTLVKICGLKTEAAVDAALECGADFVGLVFYPPSPRNVTPRVAAALAEQARGRARIVALVVDADDALLDEIARKARPDLLQLHGAETPARAAAIKARLGIPVMKAIRVEHAADAAAAFEYVQAADHILFDAKTPKGAGLGLPGGNGLAFDWHALDGVRDRLAFMLSGGLTPDNVAAAIQVTRPWAVDVSSGVEVCPGEKDLGLIAKFLAAAKST